jgi:hypothetical protein
MKAVKTVIAAIVLLAVTTLAYSQNYNYKLDGPFTVTKSIRVNGVCAMCKQRIENALKVEGITSARWDEGAKTLQVQYNKLKINPDKIQQLVAAAGHDTEKYSAPVAVYEKLPDCCKYVRGSNNIAKLNI